MACAAGPSTAAENLDLLQVGLGWRHPHYAPLLNELPALDFLEVHSENFFSQGGAALSILERGRRDYPISLHGVGLSLGSALGLDDWHLDELARLVNRIDPVRVSDHASFARANFGGRVIHASDLLPLPFTHEALHALSTNVQRVQDRLKRRFTVENLSAYVQWHTPDGHALDEPRFLNELVSRTGCSLLVDVNNIYVNALNAQLAGRCMDPLESCKRWLETLSPVAVAEIHLAGHRHVRDADGEIVIDDHGSRVTAAVGALYCHAIRCFGPVPTLVEWDTDIPPLGTLLDEVARARALAERTLGVAA